MSCATWNVNKHGRYAVSVVYTWTRENSWANGFVTRHLRLLFNVDSHPQPTRVEGWPVTLGGDEAARWESGLVAASRPLPPPFPPLRGLRPAIVRLLMVNTCSALRYTSDEFPEIPIARECGELSEFRVNLWGLILERYHYEKLRSKFLGMKSLSKKVKILLLLKKVKIFALLK